MSFNEKLHAYIAARFYVRLANTYVDRAKAAFDHATDFYGEQRGRRMARRAIADGQPLSYENYRLYCEWESSEDMKAQGCDNLSEIISKAPAFEFHVIRCPWQQQFASMGLSEAGEAYCTRIDAAICRGWNPDIEYKVTETLNGGPRCVHRIKDEGYPAVEGKERECAGERRKSFEYHCAHLYWSFEVCCTYIFGIGGKDLALEVLEDVKAHWGEYYALTIKQYEHTDFEAV